MGTLRPPYQQNFFFRPVGAFFLLKLKVTKIPIQNRPFSAPSDSLFSGPWSIDGKGPTFLDARDHARSDGKGVLPSIFLVKKSTFFVEGFSFVAQYEYDSALRSAGAAPSS